MRQVGDPVAVVVAESVYQANDAVEAIDVDFEELGVVVDSREAVKDGAPQLHENAPNNIVMHWTCGTDAETVDKALAEAEVCVSQSLFNQRLIPTAMEPRGSIGVYDPGTEEYTLWATSQAPHVHKLVVAAFVLNIPEQKIRVIAPDVGGGFGSKIFVYFDMPLVLWLSKQLGRPVKFFEDRSENYLHTTHGRDHHTDIEIGATKDGKITALKVSTLANLGAYLSTVAPGIPTTLYGRMVAGCYKIPNIHVDVKGVYTNTAMVDAYRGAGRPEATFVIERVMRSRGRRDRTRSGRGAAAQLHPTRGFSLRHRHRHAALRQRQLRPGARKGVAAGRLPEPPPRTRPSAATTGRASCSASAFHRTSRSAASRRRNGSASAARAGAPDSGRAPRSAST